MSADPLVVAPEDTLGEVAEQMCEREVDSAPVAEYGRLIGILTSRDMLRAVAARIHSSEARVRQWMTAEPITVSAATTLDIAEILMAEHGIHHLPVVEASARSACFEHAMLARHPGSVVPRTEARAIADGLRAQEGEGVCQQ